MRRAALLAAAALAAGAAGAEGGPPAADRCVEPPADVRPFVPPGACAIAVARADLDRDGRADHVVVLGAPGEAAARDETPRAVLVLAAAYGGLRVAARGARAVPCAACGGVLGDPFVGVEARDGGFTLRHHGGASWRWSADFTFAYSRRDRAWQLVRVAEERFHASDPRTRERRVSAPPRDFGKIDLRTFDPEAWKGRGER